MMYIIQELFIKGKMSWLDELILTKILNNIWIESNFDELKKICRSVSRQNDIDDLLQTCVEQFLLNKKTAELSSNQKLYFFTRIVHNQYHSKTSKFYYHFKRSFNTLYDETEIVDEDYQEPEVNLEWVMKQLDEIKQGKDWYYGRLFELYIELGCSITKLSERTTIPINSVSRDINKIRKILNKKRNGMWL